MHIPPLLNRRRLPARGGGVCVTHHFLHRGDIGSLRQASRMQTCATKLKRNRFHADTSNEKRMATQNLKPMEKEK